MRVFDSYPLEKSYTESLETAYTAFFLCLGMARIGKHSELLKITDDPLAYAKEQVAKYNEEEEKYDGY